MTYLTYIALNDGYAERVERNEIDAVEQAGIIDRTLLPVAGGAQGWARGRKDAYTVTGDIGSKRAILHLADEGVHIASVYTCLHSRVSAALWHQAHIEACTHLPDMIGPPSPPWTLLHYDVNEVALPDWIDWWAKNIGWALIEREGW